VKPFRVARGGDLVARLDPAEATVVGLLVDQLEQLLAADAEDVGDDPVLARLLPDGHRGDPEIAADYRELTESALRSGKADDLAVVRATLPAAGEEDQQLAVYYWLTAVQGSLVDALVAARAGRS
jgi:hypothetical protein